jgi:transketolase
MSEDGSIGAERLRELRGTAIQIRRLVVDSLHRVGGGHFGGSLSAAEILTALYFEILDVDPKSPRHPDRDRFILSKGHASIALYAALALRGYFPVEDLNTFAEVDSPLQGHPDMSALDALDMSAGSLGQGLSIGVGMALSAKLKDRDFHTFVLLGDGDSQEGQTWEAAFIADRLRLDNLTAILDWNGLQQYGFATEAGYGEIARRPPQEEGLVEKWQAFGWEVEEIDGHDLAQIQAACARSRKVAGKPCIVLARTVKGKGISFMENDFNCHYMPLTEEQVRIAHTELASQEEAT